MILRLFASAMLAAVSGFTAIDESKVVDLTHTFDDDTIYWPTAKPFRWHKDAWGKSPGGYWYASGSFEASEHLGTHIDSPLHFGEGQPGTADLPVERLIGPAVVIDISQAATGNPDYLLSAADIARWEKAHGKIPAKAIVLVRTGWSRFWPNRKQYMGTDVPGDVKNLHFPGISPDAAKLLLDRGVDGVGIDTASMDYGKSTDFRTHQILSAAGIYGLENLTGVDRLPATGATLIALPMKIRNGTGGPVRVVALLP